MNHEEIRDLWCRFLGGDALHEAEQQALLSAVASDQALHEQLLADAVMDGMLRSMAVGD
jgi:hypothetical protein